MTESTTRKTKKIYRVFYKGASADCETLEELSNYIFSLGADDILNICVQSIKDNKIPSEYKPNVPVIKEMRVRIKS